MPAWPSGPVTGLVLAGGAGSRMGGTDKGMLPWDGATLAGHALARLAPQVDRVAISANRHRDAYAALGVPVWSDAATAREPYAGPLAGMLAALERIATPWLATVPCDSPLFPDDLVARLCTAAVQRQAPAAIASAPSSDNPAMWLREPVFCLLHASLASSLATYLAAGGRRIWPWLQAQPCAEARFDDARAFVNINTPGELARLASSPQGTPR